MSDDLPETVIVTQTDSSISGAKAIHASDDCPQLGAQTRAVPPAVYPPAHRRRCRVCFGGPEAFSGGEQPSRKLASRLWHADPDDVGGGSA